MSNVNAMDSRWLRWSLTAIVALLAVIAVELSVLLPSVEARAQAGLPDAAFQRKQLLEAQEKTTGAVERVLKHLQSGTVKVRMEGTDKESKAKSGVKGSAQPPG